MYLLIACGSNVFQETKRQRELPRPYSITEIPNDRSPNRKKFSKLPLFLPHPLINTYLQLFVAAMLCKQPKDSECYQDQIQLLRSPTTDLLTVKTSVSYHLCFATSLDQHLSAIVCGCNVFQTTKRQLDYQDEIQLLRFPTIDLLTITN